MKNLYLTYTLCKNMANQQYLQFQPHDYCIN